MVPEYYESGIECLDMTKDDTLLRMKLSLRRRNYFLKPRVVIDLTADEDDERRHVFVIDLTGDENEKRHVDVIDLTGNDNERHHADAIDPTGDDTSNDDTTSVSQSMEAHSSQQDHSMQEPHQNEPYSSKVIRSIPKSPDYGDKTNTVTQVPPNSQSPIRANLGLYRVTKRTNYRSERKRAISLGFFSFTRSEIPLFDVLESSKTRPLAPASGDRNPEAPQSDFRGGGEVEFTCSIVPDQEPEILPSVFDGHGGMNEAWWQDRAEELEALP